MKNKIILIISLVFFTISTALTAQVKIKLGHINTNELMVSMPGRDTAQKVLEEYAKDLESQLTLMSQEFQTKYQDYLSNEASYLEPIKQSKQKELVDLEQRINDFKTQAQEMLSQKEADLIKPLIDRAKKAIDDGAVEKGYTYILDTGTGAVIYFPETDNVMSFVKEKLGIK